jgi:hypothetical protein
MLTKAQRAGTVFVITVENTDKRPGETFRAEPLKGGHAWRVSRSRDGQNVMFRVSRERAEAFAEAMNAKETGR